MSGGDYTRELHEQIKAALELEGPYCAHTSSDELRCPVCGRSPSEYHVPHGHGKHHPVRLCDLVQEAINDVAPVEKWDCIPDEFADVCQHCKARIRIQTVYIAGRASE